jgi:hypothetical protein
MEVGSSSRFEVEVEVEKKMRRGSKDRSAWRGWARWGFARE